MKNILFYNVDTQKDFINPDGHLYVKDSQSIKSNLSKLTQFARNRGLFIINSADAHYHNSDELSEVPDFIHTFPPHCIIGTEGAEFIDETKPLNPHVLNWFDDEFIDEFDSKEFVITKDKFDVFSGNPFTDIFISKFTNFEKVVVYGVVSEICVKFAVDGLLERRFKVELVEDAIYHLDFNSKNKNITRWLSNPNFKLVKTSDVVK